MYFFSFWSARRCYYCAFAGISPLCLTLVQSCWGKRGWKGEEVIPLLFSLSLNRQQQQLSSWRFQAAAVHCSVQRSARSAISVSVSSLMESVRGSFCSAQLCYFTLLLAPFLLLLLLLLLCPHFFSSSSGLIRFLFNFNWTGGGGEEQVQYIHDTLYSSKVLVALRTDYRIQNNAKHSHAYIMPD